MAIGSLRRLTGTSGFSKIDVARYAVEFIIVFVGVYLAFLLTDYQEELREREVRVKYYESLIQEFRIMIAYLDGEEEKLQKHLVIANEIESGNLVEIPVSDLM